MTKTRPLLPYAEAALVAVSLTTVAGFWRLFDSGSFFWRLTALSVASHGAAILARRLGWSLAGAAALSGGVLVLTVTWVLYPSTTFLALPTSDTLSMVRDDLANAWTQFQAVQAPTPVTGSFLLVAGLALWWAAFVADWAAFRLWVPFESVVPSGTVFIFCSLFAVKRSSVTAAALFLAACLLFILVHRITRQQTSAGWVASDVQRGSLNLLKVGCVIAVVVVALCAAIGPNLPGADADALVAWRAGESGGSSRTTVSPLVQIQSRLLNQSNQELFSVTSPKRAYWRLTALDEFDGSIWSSNGEYEKARGTLSAEGKAPQEQVVTQKYQVSNLATIWLPAAFHPAGVRAPGVDIRYDPTSATLIVGSSIDTSDGIAYEVDSSLAVFDPAQLEAATGEIPGEIAATDLRLPPELSDRVRAEAARVVAGKTTAYDKALALQDYFRDGSFQYDLNVPAGHSDSAIERFLFETRAGFCEQFAGTYAAMARTVGLPSRVAVGFTPGEQDPIKPELYHVKGEHAHAWPEVYISGQGWVAFEPTPGRGAPGAEGYTHVPEEQSSGEGATSTTLVPTSTTVAGGPAIPVTTTRPADGGLVDTGGGQPKATAAQSWWARWGVKVALVLLGMVVLALLYAIVVPLLHHLARTRRRARADSPTDEVRVAWAEAVESLGLLGVGPRRTETPVEFGRRAGRLVEDGTFEAGAFDALANLVEGADYSADGATPEEAESAWALSGPIVHAVREQATRAQRMRSALDPRPIDKRRPRRSRRARSGPARDNAPPIEMLAPT
jgi:transglutaminase-like putative cysteine protease